VTKTASNVFLSFLLLISCREAVAATPPQLYGKSVVVSWTENRVHRFVGEAQFRQVALHAEQSIYISTTGRPFSRSTYSTRRGTGSHELVGGSGHSGTAGAVVIQFQGRSLVTVQAFIGGARHIQVDFDPAFSSCTANVILGRSGSTATLIIKGAITGDLVEVQSAKIDGAKCSIKEGNVFTQ